jgi:hypothetical protein
LIPRYQFPHEKEWFSFVINLHKDKFQLCGTTLLFNDESHDDGDYERLLEKINKINNTENNTNIQGKGL